MVDQTSEPVPVCTSAPERAPESVPVRDARSVGTAVRREVAVFDNYAEAERAVDYLSDVGFPVGKVAIVGHDLKYVEQVTGRLTYAGAAWRGALTGALPGALIGWLFGLFSWVDPLIAGLLLAFYGLIFGAVVGALFGLVVHAMQGGRRDFTAVEMVVPSRFEVVADEDVADEAARLLAGAPVNRAMSETPSVSAPASAPASAPPASTGHSHNP